jgi:hypothetical protein
LSPQEHNGIVHQISDSHANMHAWTMTDIVRYASKQYGKTIDPNSMRNMLHRDPGVKCYRGIPVEQKLFQVTREDVEGTFGASAKLFRVFQSISYIKWMK